MQPPDGRALRQRKPNRRRAAALQRADSGIQHGDEAVPREPDGEDVRLQRISIFPGATRSDAGAEGEFQQAVISRSEDLRYTFRRTVISSAPASAWCARPRPLRVR